jgi:hypothetical protein
VILPAALSGILVLVSMFVDPVPSAEGRELIQGYAANKGRQGLHTNLIHYGFALFAPLLTPWWVSYGSAARGSRTR